MIHIEGLKGEDDVVCTKEMQVLNIAVNFFTRLFTSTYPNYLKHVLDKVPATVRR